MLEGISSYRLINMLGKLILNVAPLHMIAYKHAYKHT